MKKGITPAYIRKDFFLIIIIIITLIINIIIQIIIRLKLLDLTKQCHSKGRSKERKLEQRIKFGNNHLDFVTLPENAYAIHLCIDSKQIFGYCTGYLAMTLDRWTHFVNAVIPKVKFSMYDVATIFTSSVVFLET